MSLGYIYLTSKKIHRLGMWIAILFGIPLSLTGMIMHNAGLSSLFMELDLGYKVRELHRMASTPFTLALFVMMVTGSLLWLVPKLQINRSNSSKHND